MAWAFLGVSSVVEVTGTAHALVTTGIAGTLQAGDLLVACISSRIASTTPVTLPTGGEWTLVNQQNINNILATGSAAPSGLMAYCVRGASNPNLTFTHPVAPSVAIGRIIAYRGGATTSPKDTDTSFPTGTSTTAVSGAGLTTTLADDLIVAMAAGGQEAAWSAFNATSPAGASGATSTAAPTTTWLERADSLTTTGVDTSLAIFDAIKSAAGATGNLTATASVAAVHVVVAGAFKLAPPPGTPDAWDQNDKNAAVTLSNSDKTATVTAAVNSGVRSTTKRLNGAAGKFYAEFVLSGGTTQRVGIWPVSQALNIATGGLLCLAVVGDIFINATTVGNIGAATIGDVICVAWDSGAELVWFRKNNGNWNNSGTADPATGTGGFDASFATAQDHGLYYRGAVSGMSVTLRTESAELGYAGPSGFTSWMGEALVAPPVTGTGTPSAQAAAVSGLGSVSSAAATGTGALASNAAAVSGAGVWETIGTGALVAQAAAVGGSGGVGAEAATGTGAIAAAAAAVSGAGVLASVATGVLAAQAATAAGVGVSASTGTGVLTAQAATVAGSGLSVATGSGTLAADAATVVGIGASISTGTGSIIAGPAEVAGTGTAAAGDSGALVAQTATVAGLGVSGSVGVGALQTGAATISGAGLGDSFGTGPLLAGAATITAEGVVLEEGAATGTGALVAGTATVSGEGEVTGEVAPPVSVGGGRYYPFRQDRPRPVEGIGYGILPQLEGEAFGLVVVSGTGVASLPGIVGAGAGDVGVAGRSAARLAIKAAAVGDRGQVGAGAGSLVGIKAAAIGRHDDDGAAIVAFLLAA